MMTGRIVQWVDFTDSVHRNPVSIAEKTQSNFVGAMFKVVIGGSFETQDKITDR